MMNRAKKEIVMKVLQEKGGEATFHELFEESERQHCDVLTAALMSMQRQKIIKYDGAMLLMPTHKAVKVTLLKPEFDPFA